MNDQQFLVVFGGELGFAEGVQEGLPLEVRGLSCRSGYIESKNFIIPDNELINIAHSLEAGIDGHGAYLLKDHGGPSHSIDSVIGRVTSASVEDNSVYYTARLEDEDIANKIRKKLLSSASIGLRVNKMSCSLCGRSYGDPACHHLLGREYPSEKLTKQARPYLAKPVGAIVGGDLEAKEQSIVLYPAIARASVGFNFSGETSNFIGAIEAKKIAPDEDQLDEADILAMQEILTSRGKVVLDKKVYDEVRTNLDEIKERYATLEKIVWLYANCDSQFFEEMLPKIDRFDEKELTFLWETYQSLSNFGPQSIVSGEEAHQSVFDTRKEDVREVIFGVRRDGELKGLRSIKDINL